MRLQVVRRGAAWLLAATFAACGGGGDGTPPIAVSRVAITPTAPATFATVGRTLQLSAQALDAGGAVVGAAPITWSSSAPLMASVSATGLVTAGGNGTALITASAGGQVSTPVTVTIAQVLARIAVTPGTAALGRLGGTLQLTAMPVDSGGTAVPGISLPAFTRSGTGTVAAVTPGGLVTAIGAGASDTAVIGATRVPITVVQLVQTVTVGVPPASDTLFSSGVTRQFTAEARDSNNNIMAAAFSWTSSSPGVATVSGAGLVTAVNDGSTAIQASAGGVSGSHNVNVRRLVVSHSISSTSASIATDKGSLVLNGSAIDSAGAPIPVLWRSRDPTILTLSPGTGATTTLTANTNGTTRVVMSVAAGNVDSATITVTNQTTALVSFASQIQPIFTGSCAKVNCHAGAAPRGGQNLSAGVAYANIVNVMAQSVASLSRVQPGNPTDSYLVIKIEGTDPRMLGSRMPDDAPGAQPFLTAAQIQLIRNWILQGAPDN